MRFPSSKQIIEDVYQVLDALEIICRAHVVSVEGLADQNTHRRTVVGDGKIGMRGVAQIKGEGCKYKIDRNMFIHSNLLSLSLE